MKIANNGRKALLFWTKTAQNKIFKSKGKVGFLPICKSKNYLHYNE
jgi:hypothetical protein